ncbi:MAG: VWA domain-containing protein [Clostridia bacterium]|nr:VWA domain-containing protein [Clostridia bacterium]
MSNSIDVAISFDTTGSMYPCLTQVRRSVSQMVSRLFKDIPDLRIAIIAHGDYCDAEKTYVTKINDFSTNPDSIVKFVNNVGPTWGGDAPECYELVLYEARTKLNWQSGRSKILVMIGDSLPHTVSYPQNTLRIDWRNELGLLTEAGIQVYGVHAMPGIRGVSKCFYEEIAQKTGGFYLTLEQFSNVTDLIMAVCYKQEGEEAFNNFVQQVWERGNMTRDFRNTVRTMGAKIAEDGTNEDGLNPVPAGRFQVLRVDKKQSIREFVTDNGITFNKGRGFYQLTGTETVGTSKEILLVEKKTGDIFNGPEVRRLLGLSAQTTSKGANEKLRMVHLDKYNVFVQSTSYNRVLDADTNLLYEVEDWDRTDY